MSRLKLFWNIHKYAGIALSLLVSMIAVTGLLLLLKKDIPTLQPPTQRGAEGGPAEFLSIDEVLQRTYAIGHPAFTGPDDIERIDLRIDRRVHKVRSHHGFMEVQVDAVTGAILSGPLPRRSDLIERIHDGSFFADWVHGWVMPTVALGLLLLTGTGLWIWIAPILGRRARRRAARTAAGAGRSPQSP
jgi:uncharacterized iron-regulated membrane protein